MRVQTAALTCNRKRASIYAMNILCHLQMPGFLVVGLGLFFFFFLRDTRFGKHACFPQNAKQLHNVSQGGNITNSHLLKRDNWHMSSNCASCSIIASISKGDFVSRDVYKAPCCLYAVWKLLWICVIFKKNLFVLSFYLLCKSNSLTLKQSLAGNLAVT